MILAATNLVRLSLAEALSPDIPIKTAKVRGKEVGNHGRIKVVYAFDEKDKNY